MTRRTKVAGSDLGPDWNGQRCAAKAKSTGERCKSPAVLGKRVCRMHGGARGSGGPAGQRNGNFKHGQFTKEVIAARKLWKPAWRQVTQWQRDQALDRDTVLDPLGKNLNLSQRC